MGLAIAFMSFTWLGILLDSFTILLTDTHLNNSDGIFGILTFMWNPPIAIFMLYIGGELLIPKRKWYIISIYLVLGLLYEINLFLDPKNSFTYRYPENVGEHTMYALFIPGTYLSFFTISFYLIILIIGFGFLYKSFRSPSVIKRKFLMLSIGLFLLTIASVFTLMVTSVIIALFTYSAFMCGFWLLYLGLKEESAKVKKKPPKKVVEVKESLFRLSKRPDLLTEEEVTISKEKKICLVCKGKLSGFKLAYICSDCGTLYCESCARILSDLENACWVCNNPFDESKPSKPFQKEEQEGLEIKE
jgi:hypothetical protein